MIHFPFLCLVAGAVLIGLLVETAFKHREAWALPAAFVYITVFAWYFVDLYITPENYAFLPDNLLNISYSQVILFLVAYRLLVPRISASLAKNAEKPARRSMPVKAEIILLGAAVLWAMLLSWGVIRMDGNLLAALFPLEARAGMTMWQRASAGDAGPTGFLISTASYLYILTCASFGILFFFVRSFAARLSVVALMCISWPYFLLAGTRSVFLAVSVPFFFGYLLFGRQRLGFRVLWLSVAFLIVNSLFLIVITYRGRGVEQYLAAAESEQPDEDELRQRGLNMIQELCFINIYMSSTEPAYGGRYLREMTNVIPRALWTDKPLLGIDYAVSRGFEGGSSDIGVWATVSTGLIGGGLLNFGRFLGPIAPAFLMALWTGVLARWWLQRASFLRCLLFLIGLGLTFNLGRDITLLVLWPIVFGYLIVRVVEWWRRLPATDVGILREKTTAGVM